MKKKIDSTLISKMVQKDTIKVIKNKKFNTARYKTENYYKLISLYD